MEVGLSSEDPLDAQLLAELIEMTSMDRGEESAIETSAEEHPAIVIDSIPHIPSMHKTEDVSMSEISDFTSATDSSPNNGMSSSSSLCSRRGRKAIAAVFIGNEDSRAVTFCKRKDGLVKKSNQIASMTGSSVFLIVQQVPTDRPVNTYVFASQTWRSVPFSEACRQLISTVHLPREGVEYKPTTRYEDNVFDLPEGSFIENDYTPIKDKQTMSSSSDVSCKISAGVERQIKNDGSSYTTGSSIPKTPSYIAAEDNYSEDEDEVEESYFENCAAPIPTTQKRKREYSTTTLISDQRAREICFSKRKEGLFKKAFELVALTNCHLIVVVSKPLRVGELTSSYYVYASPLLRTGPHFSALMKTLDSAQVMDYCYALEPSEQVLQCREQAFAHYTSLMGHEDELPQAIADSTERDSYVVPPTAIQPSILNMRKKPAMCLTFAWRVKISDLHRSMTEEKKKRRKTKPKIPKVKGMKWGRKVPSTATLSMGNESEPSQALGGPKFMHSSMSELSSLHDRHIKPCISEDPSIPDTATDNEADLAEKIARILVTHRASLLPQPIAIIPAVTPAVTVHQPLPPPPLPRIANTSSLEARSSRNRRNIQKGREVSAAFMFL